MKKKLCTIIHIVSFLLYQTSMIKVFKKSSTFVLQHELQIAENSRHKKMLREIAPRNKCLCVFQKKWRHWQRFYIFTTTAALNTMNIIFCFIHYWMTLLGVFDLRGCDGAQKNTTDWENRSFGEKRSFCKTWWGSRGVPQSVISFYDPQLLHFWFKLKKAWH